MQWLKNVSRGVCPLLSSCRLFIYLRARKRGLVHNPSGMALSHGGLGPVSRIRIEDGGHCLVQSLVRPSSIHTPDTEGCQNKPCQTDRREESMAQTMGSGSQQKTQEFYLCDNTSNRCTHIYFVSQSVTILLYCSAHVAEWRPDLETALPSVNGATTTTDVLVHKYRTISNPGSFNLFI